MRLNAEQIKQGGLLVIEVETTQFVPCGRFLGEELNFFPYRMGWFAFLGVSFRVEPGNYPLALDLGGLEITHNIEVLAGNFSENHITVSPEQERLIRPDDEDEEIIALREQDHRALQRAYAESNLLPFRREDFNEPTTGRRTTGFGHTRYVNKQFNNRHAGIDIAYLKGTPIKSFNRGRVVLAQEMVVAGKTIVIDHGAGISSIYCHLSGVEVEVGQMMERGQKIGNMGSTGFSTGPHLHWEMRVMGVALDPDQFVANDLFSLIELCIH